MAATGLYKKPVIHSFFLFTTRIYDMNILWDCVKR